MHRYLLVEVPYMDCHYPKTKAVPEPISDWPVVGRPPGPVLPDLLRPVPVVKNPDQFHICPDRWFRPPDPAEKHRKSLEHGSSIPAGIFSDLFRWIPANFLCFLSGTGRKSSQKIRKISGRNTASIKSSELPGTGRFRAGLFDLGGLGQPDNWWWDFPIDRTDLKESLEKLITIWWK